MTLYWLIFLYYLYFTQADYQGVADNIYLWVLGIKYKRSVKGKPVEENSATVLLKILRLFVNGFFFQLSLLCRAWNAGAERETLIKKKYRIVLLTNSWRDFLMTSSTGRFSNGWVDPALENWPNICLSCPQMTHSDRGPGNSWKIFDKSTCLENSGILTKN